jgi:hypothetical protein
MITLLHRPDSIQLSGNPIDIEVLASRADGSPAVSAGGSHAILSGLQGQGLPAATPVNLNWTTPDGASRTVYFSTDGPSTGVYGIPVYSSGFLVNYWSSLAQAIGGNPEISPYFTVSYQRNDDGTYGITATARSNDPAWEVAWGVVSINYTVQNALSGTEDLGYRIRVSVFLEVAGSYSLIGEFGGPPNANSRYSFDISRMIDGAIRAALPVPGLPDFMATAPILGTNTFNYYVRISDYTTADGYGTGVLVNGVAAFAGRVGGVLQGGNFIANITADNSWLCARPDQRMVGREEPVFLSYLKPGHTSSSLTLEIEQVDNAGNSTTTTAYAGTAVPASTTVTFPVGVAALSIDANTMYYKVRVLSATNDNPWRTFIVDQREYEEARYLIYLNSFFLPEVFRCTGEISHELEAQYSTFSRVRPLNGGQTEPGRGNWSTDTGEGYVFATGYKPKAEISAMLREMVDSPRVYEFRDGGSVPLLSVGRSFSLGTTGQNLFAASLAFELAELEKGSAFGAVGDSVGGGVDVGGGVVTDPFDPGGGEDPVENVNNWAGDDGVSWTGDDDVAWVND